MRHCNIKYLRKNTVHFLTECFEVGHHITEGRPHLRTLQFPTPITACLQTRYNIDPSVTLP